MQQLHELLQRPNHFITAVAGMGGVGKTELVLQYVRQYGDLYSGSRCWFNVREQNLGTQIIEFALTYLDIKPSKELTSDLAKVKYCWSRWREGKTLIVLDDVPDYGKYYRKHIAPYLPPANDKIKVLIMSRERPGANQYLDLEVLEEDAAIELLAALINKSRVAAEPEQARELCQWLGCLPLGLELVGRYIALDGSLTIDKMLKRLKRRELEAKALLDPQQANMTAQLGVASAFNLSWQALSEEARKLASYLSLFSSEPFRWTWVEGAWVRSDDEDKRDELTENLEIIRNLQLTNRNLLKAIVRELGHTDSQYQFHSLVAKYLRVKLEARKSAPELKQKFCKMMVEVAWSIAETRTIKEIESFTIAIPHLSSVVKELKEQIDDEDLIVPYEGLVRFYAGQGIYEPAVEWSEECLEFCQTRLTEQHPDVATSLNNLALLYNSQGKYEAAEPLLEKALELTKQLLGEQHPDVATSLNNLALLYNSQGKYEAAEPLLEKALELTKQLLGEQHPNVATSLNNLALLYNSQGKYEAAEPLLEKALELRKQLLGEQHPNVATSLNNLALLYNSQGKYEAAESLLEKALELRKQLLGEQHPDVATSLNNLALLYKSQGRYAEAESLYEKALQILENTLGKNHPNTITVRENLSALHNIPKDL